MAMEIIASTKKTKMRNTISIFDISTSRRFIAEAIKVAMASQRYFTFFSKRLRAKKSKAPKIHEIVISLSGMAWWNAISVIAKPAKRYKFLINSVLI